MAERGRRAGQKRRSGGQNGCNLTTKRCRESKDIDNREPKGKDEKSGRGITKTEKL